jgi:hypothetical protein
LSLLTSTFLVKEEKIMTTMRMTTMIRAMTKMMSMMKRKMNRKIIIENAYISNIFCSNIQLSLM